MTNPLARVVMNNVSRKARATEEKGDRISKAASYVKFSSMTREREDDRLAGSPRVTDKEERSRTPFTSSPDRDRIHREASYVKLSNITKKDKDIIKGLINKESQVRDGSSPSTSLTLGEAADRIRKRI